MISKRNTVLLISKPNILIIFKRLSQSSLLERNRAKKIKELVNFFWCLVFRLNYVWWFVPTLPNTRFSSSLVLWPYDLAVYLHTKCFPCQLFVFLLKGLKFDSLPLIVGFWSLICNADVNNDFGKLLIKRSCLRQFFTRDLCLYAFFFINL